MKTTPLTLAAESKRILQAMLFAMAVALAAVTSSACGGTEFDEEEPTTPVEEPGDGDAAYLPFDAIANVQQTVVKRQSIGNCWLYATASWAESMQLASTGTQMNMSESYWTYWHWFEEIANGEVGSDNEVQTGGGWDVSKMLIARYGVVEEKSFIPTEAEVEMSARQASALAAINTALKTGALKDAAARRNRALVRAELDKAWGLSADVVKQLDKVFKKDVSQHLGSKRSSGTYLASTTGTKIKRATSVKAAYSAGPGKKATKKTLAKAIVEWKEVGYWASSYSNGRREYEQRIQKALHMAQPVIISWFVDFNALDGTGAFRAPPARPGKQGGHMTVIDDYEITNVPGFGTLKAGVSETRKEALAAALHNDASISFIRVKNSWGGFRPDRAFSVAGYHDLYSAYLFGKVKRCAEDSTSNCFDYTPLQDVVLPPGY